MVCVCACVHVCVCAWARMDTGAGSQTDLHSAPIKLNDPWHAWNVLISVPSGVVPTTAVVTLFTTPALSSTNLDSCCHTHTACVTAHPVSTVVCVRACVCVCVFAPCWVTALRINFPELHMPICSGSCHDIAVWRQSQIVDLLLRGRVGEDTLPKTAYIPHAPNPLCCLLCVHAHVCVLSWSSHLCVCSFHHLHTRGNLTSVYSLPITVHFKNSI